MLIYSIAIFFAIGISVGNNFEIKGDPFDYQGTVLFIIIMHLSLLQVTLTGSILNQKVSKNI